MAQVHTFDREMQCTYEMQTLSMQATINISQYIPRLTNSVFQHTTRAPNETLVQSLCATGI